MLSGVVQSLAVPSPPKHQPAKIICELFSVVTGPCSPIFSFLREQTHPLFCDQDSAGIPIVAASL